MYWKTGLLLVLIQFGTIGPLTGTGHSRAGEIDSAQAIATFKTCLRCHAATAEAQKPRAPHLLKLEGRVAGTIEEFRYSNSMKRAGHDGLAWNRDTLNQFLENPRSLIKGTRMSFAGIKEPEERSNLVEWLLQDGPQLQADGEREALLGSAAAAMEGDREYGEYLAGECVTCHRLSNDASAIPPIVGWEEPQFIHALYEYKTEVRNNPVMQTVTKRLADEEMAALAAYFASVEIEN